MLNIDYGTGQILHLERKTIFADRPYFYRLQGQIGQGEAFKDELIDRNISTNDNQTVISGRFPSLHLLLEQRLRVDESCITETITLKNTNDEPVVLSNIRFGFGVNLDSRPKWQLFAIPFLVQLDGSRHCYWSSDLSAGNFHNAVFNDPTFGPQPLNEQGRLRSEAWGWWCEDHGLIIIKYNNRDIELSVAEPVQVNGESLLRFGGVGTCLYSEPSRGHRLSPGGEFTFGTTHYIAVEGSIEDAFSCYRGFIDSKGHGLPADYNAPLNWNELYDIGWYHSDAEKLRESYTRETIFKEAEKAKACNCELLYLDPGWEKAEGTTLWDEERLGSTKDLVKTLKEDYDLELGFRTILRSYTDHWPHRYLLKHPDKPKEPIDWNGQALWELCLCNEDFRNEKIERISQIAEKGARFLMVDEMDWRGPCHDPDHGHPVPTTAFDHIMAVYSLCRELKKRYPGLIIECHDPLWPWHTSIYVPTYFLQGFNDKGSYQENWGFEYMWNCIDDLRSGKALALYYYNLACNIPLYLHITMAADNDNCLFFWWAASTVRHLGIGGKSGHESVNPPGLPAYDPEERFEAYKKQTALYQRLKPYFVRGVFHGIEEHIHLHTLAGHPGGVIVAFNLSNEDKTIEARLNYEILQSNSPMPIEGADGIFGEAELTLTVFVSGMSPAVIRIGEAVGADYSEG